MKLNKIQKQFISQAVSLRNHIIDFDVEDFEDFYECSKEEMEESILELYRLNNNNQLTIGQQ